MSVRMTVVVMMGWRWERVSSGVDGDVVGDMDDYDGDSDDDGDDDDGVIEK